MIQDRYSTVMFRLKPFLFKHYTIVNMYHFLSECAQCIGQMPHLFRLYDHNPEKYQTLEFSLPYQSEEGLKKLERLYRSVSMIELGFDPKIQNCAHKIPFTLMFEKHPNSLNSAVIQLIFQDVHLCGLHLSFYLEKLQYGMDRGCQPKPSDDFVIPSFEAYNLVKEWMNALQAEECWGGDSTEWFEPQYGGYHYRLCPFRFRRKGPQYVDISLEDRKPYQVTEVDEQIKQELRSRGYDKETTLYHSELWPYGRIIDATWDEYFQKMKEGINLPRRYVDEKELYENPDALFSDIDDRVSAHERLQAKLKSGEYNFDDGFMTVD